MGAAGNKKPKKPGKKHGPSYMEEEHDVPLKSTKKKINWLKVKDWKPRLMTCISNPYLFLDQDSDS